MKENVYTVLELVDRLLPFFVFSISILGVIIGKFVYGISFLQPLEKIANEQREFRRKSDQENLKKAITDRHLLLGNNFINVGNLNAAKLEFKSALTVDPINEKASMGLFKSQIYDHIENFGFTPEILMKKVDIIFQQDSTDAHAFYFMGLLYRTIDYNIAIEYFKKAIDKDPDFPDAYYRIGMLYEIVNELNTGVALSYYEKAFALSKFNQNYINNLAYQYFQLGQYQKAINTYEMLIKLDKNDILPYLTISTSYLLVGDIEKSSLFANQFVDKFQKQPNIFETAFNKMEWYFEAFNKEKILLETKEKKMVYGYISSYYKNLIMKPNEDFQIYLSRAVDLYKINPYDCSCVLVLIDFELSTYLSNLQLEVDFKKYVKNQVFSLFQNG